jgi:hypothetical protein
MKLVEQRTSGSLPELGSHVCRLSANFPFDLIERAYMLDTSAAAEKPFATWMS